MVSDTRQTQNVRKAKMTKRGQSRKRVWRNKGSTPKFPIHPPKPENDGSAT